MMAQNLPCATFSGTGSPYLQYDNPTPTGTLAVLVLMIIMIMGWTRPLCDHVTRYSGKPAERIILVGVSHTDFKS